MNFINNSTKRKFLEDFINLFNIFNGNYIFYINLANNIKLKKLFINIINEYINFLITENDYLKISTFISYFFNNLVSEFIENNYSCKKVFLQVIDCYFLHFKEILYYDHTTYLNFDNIKLFLNMYFKNITFCENMRDLDTLIYIFNNIVDIELYKYSKKIDNLSIDTIDFYIEYIATISEENKEKNSKLIIIFEKNINQFITLINSLIIDKKA